MADADAPETDDHVTLSEEELRELVREEAHAVAREETRRTRGLFVSIVAGLFGFVILGQAVEASGTLTTVLVAVGALLVVAAGVGVTNLFDED